MTISTGAQLIDLRSTLKRLGVAHGMKVAELGSGTGYFSIVAASLVGDAGRVYAIDVLKSALSAVMREARKSDLGNIVPVWSNIEVYRGARQISDKSIDIDLVINTLFQSHKHKEFLHECVRMLRPGGSMVVIDWKWRTPFGPPQEDRVDPEEVRAILEAEDLKFIENFEPGPYHFGMVFKQPVKKEQEYGLA